MSDTNNLIPAYFGSSLVFNLETGEKVLGNIIVTKANSYEEAVGVAYLDLLDRYHDDDWLISMLNMERVPVWVERDQDVDVDVVDQA